MASNASGWNNSVGRTCSVWLDSPPPSPFSYPRRHLALRNSKCSSVQLKITSIETAPPCSLTQAATVTWSFTKTTTLPCSVVRGHSKPFGPPSSPPSLKKCTSLQQYLERNSRHPPLLLRPPGKAHPALLRRDCGYSKNVSCCVI